MYILNILEENRVGRMRRWAQALRMDLPLTCCTTTDKVFILSVNLLIQKSSNSEVRDVKGFKYLEFTVKRILIMISTLMYLLILLADSNSNQFY